VNTLRVVFASARADFFERVRRYSFLFTLGSALYFGYLATVGKLMQRIGELRGIYNSAWIGGPLAMVGSTFISLAGFYFVNNSIQRDRETRVGRDSCQYSTLQIPLHSQQSSQQLRSPFADDSRSRVVRNRDAVRPRRRLAHPHLETLRSPVTPRHSRDGGDRRVGRHV
jgi:hypothetical protein